MELPLVIDCQTCVVRFTDACRDCVVTFLCDAEEEKPVVFDESEARVLRLLRDGGLVADVRHTRAS